MESKDNKNNEKFEEYRSQMHRDDDTVETRDVVPAPKRSVAIAFGIFMIIVYIGVGILFLTNFFNIAHWINIVLGVLFIVYGIFRGYRMFAGVDYYRK